MARGVWERHSSASGAAAGAYGPLRASHESRTESYVRPLPPAHRKFFRNARGVAMPSPTARPRKHCVPARRRRRWRRRPPQGRSRRVATAARRLLEAAGGSCSSRGFGFRSRPLVSRPYSGDAPETMVGPRHGRSPTWDLGPCRRRPFPAGALERRGSLWPAVQTTRHSLRRRRSILDGRSAESPGFGT
jgi:hypothetical protein